ETGSVGPSGEASPKNRSSLCLTFRPCAQYDRRRTAVLDAEETAQERNYPRSSRAPPAILVRRTWSFLTGEAFLLERIKRAGIGAVIVPTRRPWGGRIVR